MKISSLLFFTLFSMDSYGQTIWDSVLKAKSKAATGNPFPSFNTLTDDGSLLTNESLRGKVVFVNFWFESCTPCIAEMDALNELYSKLKENKNFEFISFTYEKPKKIREVKEKFHIQYKVASVGNEECYRLNQNNGFPTSMILDRNGAIKYLAAGGRVDKVKAREFIMTEVFSKILLEL